MRKILFLLIISVCSIGGFAQTQGTLEAFDAKGAAIGACPLKHTSVKADISGFIGRVTVTQEFENNLSQPIEAVYAFPLSQNSAVDAMTMLVGGRTIRGKILRREEAAELYNSAKNAGKTASLLDQERPNIFTQSVANILPNEKISITISYVETLKYEDGSYEFVFPMTLTPRYMPSSVKAEDANKIAPPIAKDRAGHDISIEVNLNAGVPVEAIRSNSHEIETANLSANSASVRLKDEKVIPNKDFILRYDVSGKRIEDAILTHRDARGGFFTLILQPPDTFRNEDVTPKEIVFVLDTSGSMSGFPIEKAKEAMKLSLDNLYPNDTFNLITFAGDTQILFDAPVLATQANLEKAKAFLESRSGGGGTEMMTAIKAALAPSDAGDHVRIVCFMTDGAVGNDAEIISEVQKHPNARVFSFGIGNSINRYLLDKIAEEGSGEAEFVTLADDGSKAAKRFYERVRTPLLTDVSIDWNGLPVADVYPNRLADLFSAKPVIVYGRYTKAASGTIKLKGKIGGIETTREIAVVFPEAEAENDALATLWARQRIDDLTKQDSRGVPNGNAQPDLSKTIESIGLEYNLLTQFTSFVAVEETIKTQGGKPVKVEVPVTLPEGMGDGDSPFRRLEIMSNLQRPPSIQFSAAQVVANRRNIRKTGSASGSGSGNGNGSANYGMLAGVIFGGAKPPPPPKKISGGVLNGKATSLPTPAYPAAARAVRAGGAVNVQITTDESGRVVSATAVSGHPLLRAAAEKAANGAKFAPTMLSGQPIKVIGTIIYNFDPKNADSINVTVGETRQPTDEENIALSPENLKNKRLAEKLHVWLFAVVERRRTGETAPTAHESKFIKDGKAEIQIIFSAATPAALEKLKSLRFEISGNEDKNSITGKISIEQLANLTEIAEVKYVLPKIK